MEASKIKRADQLRPNDVIITSDINFKVGYIEKIGGRVRVVHFDLSRGLDVDPGSIFEVVELIEK